MHTACHTHTHDVMWDEGTAPAIAIEVMLAVLLGTCCLFFCHWKVYGYGVGGQRQNGEGQIGQ